MMKNNFKRRLMVLALMLPIGFLMAQNVRVSGKVTDATNGEPLPGVTVQVKGTSDGVITGANGEYEITVSSNSAILIFSSIGYTTTEIAASDAGDLSMEVNVTSLGEIVVTGRGKPRTVIESPVPIDNISASALVESGQVTIDQMINFKVPSYNSSNQTISDATAHFDPSELRNLGPSRTLVLVNGKRKNQSALVYVNDTPGKGEVGVDMKAIPSAAIERVEVLRDGAAAQYGSDAIAGVINIVLKERVTGLANINSGVTTEGDGFMYEASVNKGFQVGNGGVLNLTGNFYHQDKTDRAGEPGSDALFGVDGTNAFIQENPDLGMIVGQPEYDKASFAANFNLPYGDNGEFYAFGAYTYRDGKSFALYRTPYWITDDFGLLTPSGETYNGFQPTFETAINDMNFSIGTKNKFSGWDADISFTTGSNSVDYTIGNTINVDLGAASPTSFDAGAYAFNTVIGNLDVSKTFGKALVYLGSEVRREGFEVTAGQPESFSGGGAQSFPGLQESNELDESRNNVGFYGGFDLDVTETFLVGGAIRFENYSDFGSNLSWKVNARQLFANSNGAVRASLSTGFRAPSLHQIYLSNIQTLVSGGTVSNQGTFNNVSDVVRGLGIPALDAETSFNITAGLTYRFTENFSASIDYYNIDLDDRVLFTGEIGFDGDDATTNQVEQILIDNSVTSIKFFVNALDTKTSGVDIILDYSGISFGATKADIGLSMNYNETKIDGAIVAPGVVGETGYDIFNRKEQSRVTTARPNLKIVNSIKFYTDDFSVNLNNTYFGEVTWQHATDPTLDQTFAGKVITDLIVGYNLTEKLQISATVNNLLNVFPDEIEAGSDPVTDLGGRFRYPWEVNQFGFNGTFIRGGLAYKF